MSEHCVAARHMGRGNYSMKDIDWNYGAAPIACEAPLHGEKPRPRKAA